MNIKLFNKTDFKIPQKILDAVEKSFHSQKEINLIALPPEKIKLLKEELFHISDATDVIAVNSQGKTNLLGDIYICPEVIEENSTQFESSYREELTRVIVHGILHLKGFDHSKSFTKDSLEKMFVKQEEIVNKIFHNLA